MKTSLRMVYYATLGILLMALASQSVLASSSSFPANEFQRNIERALEDERFHDATKAKEHWAAVAEDGKALLAIDPESSFYLTGTARGYYGIGDYRQAADTYERLLSIKEKAGDKALQYKYAWSYVYLGLCYAKLGDQAKVVQYWSQVPEDIGEVYTTIKAELARLKK